MDQIAPGIAFILLGLLVELSYGSIRRWFDWREPKRRYPKEVDLNLVAMLICNRILLYFGLFLIAYGLLLNL